MRKLNEESVSLCIITHTQSLVSISASMIYQPKSQYKLTPQEEEIYRRIIERHRKFITEKYNFTKRHNDFNFCLKHQPKSRFYDQNRQNLFANALLDRSNTSKSKFSLSELEKIPAEEFLELCEKLSNVSVKDGEQTGPQKSLSRTKRIKSICRVSLYREVGPHQAYESLEKNVTKLLPKLSKKGQITNRQFFQLFMKKSKEVKKLRFIKEQIQLQIQHENYLKVEAIMTERKTAKQFMVALPLIEHFRTAILESIEHGKRLCEIIKEMLPKLEEEIVTNNQQNEVYKITFSIENIKMCKMKKRIEVFQTMLKKLLHFNQRLDDYFEGELQTSITIRELRFFVDYFNTSIQDLSLQVNNYLTEISQQLQVKNEDLSSELPTEASNITNSYARSDFRRIHEDFMSYKCFLGLLYGHLENVLHLKDLMAQGERIKKSSSIISRMRTGIRIT